MIHIGTSGWSYKHWKEKFYPSNIKESEQLGYYVKHFSTVEINNSFYRLPDKKVFEQWRKSTPPHFVFAVKASRFITHMKKLKTKEGGFDKFFSNAEGLKEKLGVILFQLPPRWKINIGRLEEFLKILPKGYRYAFEFREHSWYYEEVYQLLRTYDSAFCIYELEHHLSPLEVTADYAYVRLHGPGNKYQGSYTEEALAEWSKRCKKWKQDNKDVFVYFDNDQDAYAVHNAQRLITLTES